MPELADLQKVLKYRFKKLSLLKMALVHRSYGHEKNLKDNQRLEFLGDAVLGLVVAEILYRKFPKQQEGFLSKYRSSVVNQKFLADMARSLDLGPYLLLSGGKKQQESRFRDSVLSDLLEAIIGAVFLDGGYNEAKKLVRRWFVPMMGDAEIPVAHTNHKGRLQELSQRLLGAVPKYAIIAEDGEEHQKVFVAQVVIKKHKATGRGSSKKQAQQVAAEKLWHKLQKFDAKESE